MLRPEEINEIHAIVAANGYWGDGFGLFRRLGLGENANATGRVGIRIRQYLQQAHGDACERILDYFAPSSQQGDGPWRQRGLKLFISHRDKERAALVSLADALPSFGIVAFLAHDAIPAGAVWRDELELGLKTMDALLAYCSHGFADSEWTGQEVGYAFGRNVPVVAVLAGEAPRGLLNHRQALRNGPDTHALASAIYERLKIDERVKPQLGEGIAREFKLAGTWDRAWFLASELAQINSFTERSRRDVRLALEVNNQTELLKDDERLMAVLLPEGVGDAEPEIENRIWLVPPDHPYRTGNNHIPHVYHVNNYWKIVWRSFDSMKRIMNTPQRKKPRPRRWKSRREELLQRRGMKRTYEHIACFGSRAQVYQTARTIISGSSK